MYQIYFILEWHSTCFGRSFHPSSGVQDCTHNNRHLSSRYCCLLANKYLSIWTNLNIAFQPTNKIYQQLSDRPSNINPSRIYQHKCNRCNHAYITQIPISGIAKKSGGERSEPCSGCGTTRSFFWGTNFCMESAMCKGTLLQWSNQLHLQHC